MRWTIGLMALACGMAAAQPPGFGPPGSSPDRKLVKDHDANGDGKLDAAERQAARAAAAKGGRAGGKKGFGPPGGKGRDAGPVVPGPRLKPADAPSFDDRPIFDRAVLRTFFFEFADTDWEAQLADFYRTDVEVPATLTVDGKTYPNVGVGFRGASSFFMVSAGRKRSLSVSLDYADKKQRLLGAKSLNLLNGNGDATLMSAVLYSMVANQYLPAPRANLVKVVVNGEYWGVYTNVEQCDGAFAEERFPGQKPARWKVPGSPNGRGGLEYLGDDPAAYKQRYAIKSKDRVEDWQALVKLCKTLNQTPVAELEAALRPMLDLEGTLRFLALDNALCNSDGYWVRASDYAIVRDGKGVFHFVPHDMNEAFRGGGGGPGMGGPGGRTKGGERGFGGKDGRPREEGFRPPFEKDGPPPGFGKDGLPPGFGKDGPPPGFGKDGPRGFGRGGPGGGPGGGGGVELDPLIGMDDATKPLRSKLLKVPALRARYLELVRQIAREQLDWKTLGPQVAALRELVGPAVKAETRGLSSHEDFLRATAEQSAAPAAGRRGASNLREFAEQRAKYLLAYKEKPAGASNPAAPPAADRKRP